MSERFYVLEHSGYPISAGAMSTAGNQRELTEVMVLDRDYCHAVVWSSATHPRRAHGRLRSWRQVSLAKRRAHAADLAATLNEAL